MKAAFLPFRLIGSFTIPVLAAAEPPVVDIYKRLACGCCGKWMAHMKASGFTVRRHDTHVVTQHKHRLGVP